MTTPSPYRISHVSVVVKSSLVLIVLKRRLALYVYLYSYVLARIQHWCWQVQQNEEQTLEHLLKAVIPNTGDGSLCFRLLIRTQGTVPCVLPRPSSPAKDEVIKNIGPALRRSRCFW